MADFNRRLYLLYLLHLRRRRRFRYRNRHIWVDPIIKVRYLDGLYYNLYDKLLLNPTKFFNFFRMSQNTFEFILVKLCEIIKKEDTNMRMAIPPAEMLAVTIRYLATGASLTEMHYTFRIGISTLSGIINHVCSRIWDTFRAEYLKEMTKEDWEVCATEFQKRANFPMCLGAIDGKHIRIQNFPHSGSMFYNFKKFYSIVLLAIVDSHYKFIFADIGAYGKDCDSTILQSTGFWQRLNNFTLNLPKSKPLNEAGLKVPYVFVADSAFALQENIMKDFSNHNLSVKQRVFNYRLHRARRYVECAFGIMTNKWRIFHKSLNVSKPFSKNIVKACVVLHNIVRTKDVDLDESDAMITAGSQLRDLPVQTATTGKTGKGVRSCFANYFVSKEGLLPWQLTKI